LKAMRLVEYGRPLELKEVDTPETDTAILVKVVAAGVCHTDIHVIEGSYDLGERGQLKMSDRGVKLPLTPGHEIAGEVAELGRFAGKTKFREGDRVVVFPWLGCGSCRKCKAGFENMCEAQPRSLGIFRDGGYAEYVSVPDPRYLVPADGLRAEEAATLACSGLTSYSALNKCGVESGEVLVIIGAGGLGTTAIQLASRTTGAKVVVLDIDEAKLSLASGLGADETVNTAKSERDEIAETVRRLSDGRGADAVIDFVGNPSTSGAGFDMLAKQGRLVQVGLFGGSATFPLPVFPLRGLHVMGSFTGTLSELGELVKLAASGVVKPVVSVKYKLEDANAALQRLGEGEISGRAILRPY
jgi:propanol-preferring alcohol dehydrogenase